MLTILYKSLIGAYQLSNFETEILGGMVATFTGNREVGICKPNQVPLGFFIENLPDPRDPNTPLYNLPSNPAIRVAMGFGEYQTDVYDKKGLYRINDLLYCDINGKITNNPAYKGNPIIGIVNMIENGQLGFISIFSNLESASEPEIKKTISKTKKTVNKFNRYTAAKGK